MPKTAVLPDGRTATFPDDATVDEITTAVNAMGAAAAPVSPSALPELTLAQKIVRGSAGSIIGGALGATGGTLVAPGPGTVVGAMVGSGAGEAITQFVDPLGSGVTDASVLQIAAATALPGVGPVARRFFTSLPGATAGLQDFLFKRLGDAGERLIAKFAPMPGTASRLFEAAKALGATTSIPGSIGGLGIPLTSTATAAREITEEVGKSQFATGTGKALAARATAFAGRNQVPFDEFRLNQSDLGAVVRSLERQGGAALGRAKKLYAAMWDDMDDALANAQGPLATTLRSAIDAFKREEAATFMKEFITKSSMRRVGRPNLDIDALMTKIDRHRDVLKRLMPESEIGEILTTLAPLAKIPTMAKTPQLGFEQMPFAQRMVVSGLIGGTLGQLGSQLGFSGAGALTGATAGVLATEAMSLALNTRPGRLFIRSLMERGAGWDQIGNALLQSSRVAVTPRPAPQVAIPPMLR